MLKTMDYFSHTLLARKANTANHFLLKDKYNKATM